MLQCPAVVLPGDRECRPFTTCGECLERAASLGCAWCANPGGTAFCTSATAGAVLCPVVSASRTVNRGAPLLGSSLAPHLSTGRCPLSCPSSTAVTALSGAIQFGSLGSDAALPYESVYRPSDVGTCSWFVNPSEDAFDSSGRGQNPLRATIRLDTFALGYGDGIIVFDGLGPLEAAPALAVFLNASAVDPDAPAGTRALTSAAGPAHRATTVGDLPMALRAALDAAAGAAVESLSRSRALTSAGRFTLADSVPVVTGPASVKSSGATGDLRLVLAVADTGGGWGFRASHQAATSSSSELQLVLQVLGGTIVVLLSLLVMYQVVARCERRRRRRLLGHEGLDNQAPDEEEDDEEQADPPRVAMSQALIDAFPVFVFEKSKMYSTPLKRRGRPGAAPAPKLQGATAGAPEAQAKPEPPADRPAPIRAPEPEQQGGAPQAGADEEVACPVCMCEFEEGEQVRVLSCNHSFHCQCIDVWMAENGTCPMCRSDTLEMAVMLMSMGDAGVESPIRFGGDVRMVRAADVPRVPLLERLEAEGTIWGGRPDDELDIDSDEVASDDDVPDLPDDTSALAGASAADQQAAPSTSVANPMLHGRATESALRSEGSGLLAAPNRGVPAADSSRALVVPERAGVRQQALASASARERGGGSTEPGDGGNTSFVNPMHAARSGRSEARLRPGSAGQE